MTAVCALLTTLLELRLVVYHLVLVSLALVLIYKISRSLYEASSSPTKE